METEDFEIRGARYEVRETEREVRGARCEVRGTGGEIRSTRCVTLISRAERFSPQSAAKDAAILQAVAERLEQKGCKVTCVDEDAADEALLAASDIIVSMGRSEQLLQRLSVCEQRGVLVVNRPDAVALCRRRSQLEQTLRAAGLPLPAVPAGTAADYLSETAEEPRALWLKRGDAPVETADDVVFVADAAAYDAAMQRFHARGISDVVVSPHVAGDVVKFYAVAGTGLLRVRECADSGKFGHGQHNGPLHHYHYDAAAFADMVWQAGRCCGLTAYGGDAIIRADGSFCLIDLNDWPSFSSCRDEAADAIVQAVLEDFFSRYEVRGARCENTLARYEDTAFLFDYGGTLDTGGEHWGRVIWQAYLRAGVPVSEEQFNDAYVYGERTLGRQPIIQPDFTFRRTLETKLRLQLEHLVETGALTAAVHPLTTYLPTLLSDLYDRTCRHTAYSREVLRQLKEQRGCRMVLVSNFYGNLHTVLAEFGLSGLFESVVESAVVGVRKPDARIFTLGVEALGVPAKDVIVVGDSWDKDIVPARQAGCRTVWYCTAPGAKREEQTACGDRIIGDLQELLD